MPGTIRKMTVEGISFLVPADANFSFKPSEYNNEAIATSGETIYKKTKVSPTLDMELIVNPTEMDVLVSYASQLGSLKISVVDAEGYTMRAEAQISIESYEKAENKAKLTVLPKGGWTTFAP